MLGRRGTLQSHDRVRVTWVDIVEHAHGSNAAEVAVPQFVSEGRYLCHDGHGKRRAIKLYSTWDDETQQPYGILAIPVCAVISTERVSE